MKAKLNFKKTTRILASFIWILIAFVIVIETNVETGRRVFDFSNLFRLIPFFLIYLSLEYCLFPLFQKNHNVWRYLVGAIVGVLVITSIWFYIVAPKIPVPIHKRVAHQEMTLKKSEEHSTVGMHKFESPSYCRPTMNNQSQVQNPPPKPPPGHPRHPHFLYFFLVGLAVFAFYSTLNFIFQWMQSENERNELAKLKAEADLRLLRYQLSPHFLMNTLNNIHVLIEDDTDAAQESVRLLSKMMRYMLYDANNEKVSLVKEVNFINNYIELMKMRYIDKVSIDFSYPEEIPDVSIPPSLFINLVENAFKHGVSYVESSFVRCTLEADSKMVTFRVANSISQVQNNLDEVSGVGVDSLCKRLDILYPRKYVYQVECTDNQYSVNLQIPTL